MLCFGSASTSDFSCLTNFPFGVDLDSCPFAPLAAFMAKAFALSAAAPPPPESLLVGINLLADWNASSNVSGQGFTPLMKKFLCSSYRWFKPMVNFRAFWVSGMLFSGCSLPARTYAWSIPDRVDLML